MPAASVITLHQKLVGGTVKAIIHHPTDFAGVQWDVLSNFFVLQLDRTKEFYIYIYLYLYMCPAVHIQVWTHDLCFIWSSPKGPAGGVWGRLCGIQLTDTPKACREFEVPCKLSPNQKAVATNQKDQTKKQQTLFERFQRDQKLECGVRPDQRYTRLIIPKLGWGRGQQQVGGFWTSGQISKGQTLK
jgi:hypothetical protein